MGNDNNVITNANQQRFVEAANRVPNPMQPHPNPLHYMSPDGNEYQFFCRTKANMDPKHLKWAFKLAERNVGPYYKELSIGWQPKVKQNQLNKQWARYLVATDKSNTPVGYVMFRFDMDYGCAVLYCYELQIESSCQRQGLGRFLMTALEACANHWKMEKVVLTALKNNPAQEFFTKLGYKLDETSPGVLENADYVIMSKNVG